MTILGYKISKDFFNDLSNYNKLLEKIRSQIIFWKKFKPSLIGRLTVAKTFSVKIGVYVKGNINIPLNKVFTVVGNEGIGMIEISLYIRALKIDFYSKTLGNEDFWAKELCNVGKILKPHIT